MKVLRILQGDNKKKSALLSQEAKGAPEFLRKHRAVSLRGKTENQTPNVPAAKVGKRAKEIEWPMSVITNVEVRTLKEKQQN